MIFLSSPHYAGDNASKRVERLRTSRELATWKVTLDDTFVLMGLEWCEQIERQSLPELDELGRSRHACAEVDGDGSALLRTAGLVEG